MIDPGPLAICSIRLAGRAALTVGGEEKVRLILTPAPADLVDLLLNLERLEVVKFGLVRLELGIELVLARLLLALVALEQHYAAALVACSEVVARVVELDGRDYVCFRNVFHLQPEHRNAALAGSQR